MEIISNPIFIYVFIFVARVVDVALGVFRLLLLTRGYAFYAAIIGFFEVTIFVVALGTALSGGVTDVLKIIAYACGFATGNLVGIKMEEKMALGFVLVQMFPANEYCDQLVENLRNKNYGVTLLYGEGMSGPREIVVLTVKRKDLPVIIGIMQKNAPDTFFNISDIRSIRGGIFPRRRP
jgi:uncharacterized protein YebE (UPF0316 family)